MRPGLSMGARGPGLALVSLAAWAADFTGTPCHPAEPFSGDGFSWEVSKHFLWMSPRSGKPLGSGFSIDVNQVGLAKVDVNRWSVIFGRSQAIRYRSLK
jgi:hypothetical protein